MSNQQEIGQIYQNKRNPLVKLKDSLKQKKYLSLKSTFTKELI